jgi:monofunctional biosynthetic peptidoglycan transglycosylase
VLRKAKLGLLLLFAAGAGYALFVVAGLPPRAEVRALVRKNPGRTALMRQREAEAKSAGRRHRFEHSYVPIARISRNLIHAVIASEDQKFFGHEGVDWEAIQASIEKDIEKRRFAVGGSTISQQLVKNLFFSTHKSVTRKLREVLVVRWLEADLSKRRILELYLNVIEWGDGVYGCEAASRRYYAKPASDLDEDEAAGLAGMIPNPRRIHPEISPARFARAQKRVVWLMARAGYIRRDLGSLGTEPPPEPAGDPDALPAGEP